MSTSIIICNMALFHLGINKKITAFTDDTEEARACDLFYDQARKHVLESFPWNFACKYQTLPEISEGNPQGFEFAYQLPSDCLKVRKIFNESFTLGDIDFKIVGQELWTDMEDACIEYTYDNSVEGTFDNTFITAFARKLASDLAMPLTRKTRLEADNLTAYFGYLSIASSVNAIEGLDTKEKTDDLIKARQP